MIGLVRSENLRPRDLTAYLEEIGLRTRLVTQDFQSAFSNCFGRLKTRLKETQPDVVLGGEFPQPVAFSLTLPGLNIHCFIRGLTLPFHGSGDVCILEVPENGTYLCLYGETQKCWLDRGIKSFAVPGVKAFKEEVEDILRPWREFYEGAGEEINAKLLEIAGPMKDPPAVYNKYVLPYFHPSNLCSIEVRPPVSRPTATTRKSRRGPSCG